MSTLDARDAVQLQQNTVEPIIIKDAVYTGCGTACSDTTNPRQ